MAKGKKRSKEKQIRRIQSDKNGFDSEQSPRARNASISKGTSSGYRFHNPYNFVRYLDKQRPDKHVLGNCPPPPHDRYVGLTGRITCKVEAVTPLFISDSHAVREENGHKTYRFFQYESQPALPASSLRGMVRSVFEAVTNSCFEVFDTHALSYRLPSNQSPLLVPTRVERHGEKWQLRLLTGTTPLQIGKPPKGVQYAAWYASYWPLKPSKTLQDGHSLFIKRTRRQAYNPDGVAHGEECYALLQLFQHPHPRIQFWDVLEIRRERSALPADQRIERGWLCVTNQNVEPKHSERFFFRANNNHIGPELIDLPEDVLKAFENLIKDYQERHREEVQSRQRKGQDPGKPAGDKPGLSRFIYRTEEKSFKEGELVYAMLEGKEDNPRVKFLMPVSVSRVSYLHSVGELLPDFLHRCKDYNNLCPACRVFSWVHDSEEETGIYERTSYAGRVRFSHGIIAGNYEIENEITLAILSTPKPTTTSFYLLNSKGQPDPMVTYDTGDARLRGRKFYRHQGEARPEEYSIEEKSDQNRTVQGVQKPGAMFNFTVDFENLAPLELGALLYALELEEGMVHRLGYAKPLGFGSVKVTVEKTEIIDWETRLKSIEPNSGWQTVNLSKYKQDFLKEMRTYYGKKFDELLAELRALLGTPPGLPIHYPRPTVRLDSNHPQYEWFVGNKRRIEKYQSSKPPEPVALGLATEVDHGLPLIKKDGKEG